MKTIAYTVLAFILIRMFFSVRQTANNLETPDITTLEVLTGEVESMTGDTENVTGSVFTGQLIDEPFMTGSLDC